MPKNHQGYNKAASRDRPGAHAVAKGVPSVRHPGKSTRRPPFSAITQDLTMTTQGFSAVQSGCYVDLNGQVALVTGASRGIGRSIAVKLASCGAVVVGVARTVEALEGTLSAIEAAGGKGHGLAANVANPVDVARVVEEVEARFEKIHILVNNAGITRDGLMLRMEDDAWQEVIDTNLKGTFLFSRAVGAMMMRARYGRIINISSVAGLVGNPGQANYSASKAGVIGLSRTAARELAPRGITVNVVAPGFITTDMTQVLPEKIKNEVKERIPLRRFGTPEEIADLVAYLAGPTAGYLTGQVIAVDGGLTA
jgi:3-oxoacyl-[acyl-carrier protein] reductase